MSSVQRSIPLAAFPPASTRRRPRFGRLVIAISLLGGLLAGCADRTILTGREKRLDIESGLSRDFHSALYFPNGLGLRYPGYLIGVQKGNRAVVAGDDTTLQFPSFLTREPAYFQAEKSSIWGLGSQDHLDRLVGQRDSLFIAHVTKYGWQSYAAEEDTQEIQTSGSMKTAYSILSSCFLHNVFMSETHAASPSDPLSSEDPDDWMDLTGPLDWKTCSNFGAETELLPTSCPGGKCSLYEDGVGALNRLYSNVTTDLATGNFSHVVVVVMGWNTTQNEALRNVNDIVGNLITASQECVGTETVDGALRCVPATGQLSFRPLVVAVTWPSLWSNEWWNAFSYGNKANDADELGISWLNVLTNYVLPAAVKAANRDTRIPIVMIGHSFGARAVMRAVSAEPALKIRQQQDAKTPMPGANLVVGLQGAFSINRFVPSAGQEGGPLRDFTSFPDTQLVLTASKHDTAAGNPLIVWYPPTGSQESYQEACDAGSSAYAGIFHCLVASDFYGRTRMLNGIRFADGFQICSYPDEKPCILYGSTIDRTYENKPDASVLHRKVVYFDTSDGITKFNSLGSGGNAHSDIYRLPTGRLLWTLMRSYP